MKSGILPLAAGVFLSVICFGEELRLPLPGAERTVGGFLTTRGEIPPHDLRAKVRYDEENLYVTVFSELEPGRRPNAAGSRDDDLSMFDGDLAEVILAPEPESGVYYHLALNPNGALYSARKRDTSWNPSVGRKTETGADAWSAELTIPFSAFGGKTPGPGTAWGINFASGRGGPGRYTASWSGARSYHDVKQLGRLVFGTGKTADQVPPVHVERLRLRNGVLSCAVSLPEGGSPSRFRVQMILDGKTEKTLSPDSRGEIFSWEGRLSGAYLPLKSSSVVELRVTGVPDGRILLHRKALVNSVQTSALCLDKFYYTPADREIRYSHDFPEPAKITVRGDGKTVHSIQNAPKQGVISLAAPPLKPGRYVMEISSGAIRTTRLFFHCGETPSLAPISPDAEFRISDGIFRIAGSPVFLLGASPTGKSFLHFGDAFNLQYGRYGVQPNAAVIAGMPGYFLTRKPATGYVFPPDAVLKRTLDRFLSKGVPADRTITRIAYEAQMKVYEKDGKGNLTEKEAPGFYAALYRYLKKKAPDRLFSIHIDHHDHLREFASNCDVFETSYWSSSFSPSMIPNLDRDMGEAKKAAGRKPVVFWLGGTIPDPFCRTAEELRAGVYLAVLHDMAGVIFHMGHGHLPESRTRLWSLISGINAEIRSFYPAFRRGEAFPNFVLESTPDLAYAARRDGDRVTLIAVNLSGAENSFFLKTRGGAVRGTLTPYEPRIWHLNY